ncbi:Integrin alpha-PS3-like Protein [Tribolium castaneum]|uniref:Integrin alpha-PS3-like Protein n=2 Tax=Tribolium castaneum TaxID=7070 RepID=D6WZA6_TRICA|nr:Integrin alpha-PS3-like Protein [Tribolium castaneum]
MLRIILSLFSLIICSNCFNIDTNFPIVYQDTQSSSYFGYSTILYPGNQRYPPWLLVGAPKATNPFTTYKNPGACFKCVIGDKCHIFNFTDASTSPPRYEEKLDGAWIGGSMDISYKHGRVVVCAPRWIKIKKKNGKYDDFHMEGACYWFHTNDNTTQKLLPLFEPDHAVYSSGGGAVYNYAQGAAGISAHMPVKEKHLVLGAPGVFNWDGTSILYTDGDNPSPVASRLRNKVKRYADIDEFSHSNVANAMLTSQTVAYDLLGYATTSGYFYRKSQLLYVTAAPRSDYKGQILIYKFEEQRERPLDVKETRFGHQFGEYFGGSLTAGDVNGDGLDDLVVGAPFHTTGKFNEGKVYIFLGSGSGSLRVPKRESILGGSTNGQFGSTVQFLGDVDHDGFGDVAVAAPYEESKSGVVYLYRGSSDGLITTPSQRIVGKNIYPEIRGFGVSISRPADIDTNSYPDIAIGAYLSGHAVVLRSRPVVTIYQELKSFSQHLDFKEKRFKVRACFWYRLDELDPPLISITRYLLVDQDLGRAHLEGNSVKTISLNQNRQHCENFTITLQDSFSNRYNPITVSLKHNFLIRPETKKILLVGSNSLSDDMFCPRCPVYNKHDSVSSSIIEIPFALGCGPDNICKASLEFTSHLIDFGNTEEFILGSKNYITLETVVRNLGERAYLTQLEVEIPKIVTLRSIPSTCAQQNSSVLCSVDNPLETNSLKKITLELDMTTVNSGKYDDFLNFTIKIFTSSENDQENVKQLVVKLGRRADVTITGKSEEQSYSYKNLTQGRSFAQTYQVQKFGSSPLNEISIEINVPHILGHEIFINLYQPVGTLSGQKLTCSSNFTYIVDNNQEFGVLEDDKVRSKRSLSQIEVFNKSAKVRERITDSTFDALQNRTFYINCSTPGVTCSRVVCSGGPIDSYQTATLKLQMFFNTSAIKDLFGKKDVILFATQGRVLVTSPANFVQSGGRTDNFDVVSLFIGETIEEKVELWIIIISVIAGLLLLLLVILGLIKAGFFKRTKKEELEQLRLEMEFNQGGHSNTMETLDDGETEEEIS